MNALFMVFLLIWFISPAYTQNTTSDTPEKIKKEIKQDRVDALASFQEVVNFPEPSQEEQPEEFLSYQKALRYIRDAYFYAGSVAMDIEQWDQAISFFEKLVTDIEKGRYQHWGNEDGMLEKRHQEALEKLAEIDFKRGKYSDPKNKGAAEKYYDLTQKFPQAQERDKWYYQCGKSYFKAQKYLTAFSKYDKVLEINTQSEYADDALNGMIVICYEKPQNSSASLSHISISDFRSIVGNLTYISKKYQKLQNANNILYDVYYTLNLEMVSTFPDSEFTPASYINMGALDRNKGNEFLGEGGASFDQADEFGKLHMREQVVPYFNKAYDNYVKGYDHEKATMENKLDAKGKIERVKGDLVRLNYVCGNLLLLQANQEGVQLYDYATSHCKDLLRFSPDIAKNLASQVGNSLNSVQDYVSSDSQNSVTQIINRLDTITNN